VKLINGLAEFAAHGLVVILGKLLALILAEVEAVERVFQGEGVRDLKLLPGHHAPSPDFVRLNLEPTVLVIKQVGFLGVDSWQDAHDGPAEKSAIRCRVATVEKRVFLLGVAVDVTVDPNVPLFILGESLE